MSASAKRSRRGSWIAIGVIAAAAAGYLMLFFLPATRQMSATLKELDGRQSFIMQASSAYRACQAMQRDFVETRAYLAKYEPMLVQHSELPALYGQISHIARAHDVATPKFEPRLPTDYESFSKRSIDLGVSGSFAAIHRLVRDLEALPARLWITDMKFRGPREVGKPVECDLMLVVFVDNPEKSN